ncbi:DEAD/DEAH box helicase [Pseudoxanthobacter sp.]|uniref:DEAD/DEAH box helicase n=1 Tax=Pseudoxanthobacter sp. TaxID=1925742 RepID=UPI002FE0989F
MAFSTLHPALARALAGRDYTSPTPVQSAVLTGDAAGRDLLVSAQTGSGKTVAYGLAIARTLLSDDEPPLGAAGAPLALVIAPTRELALQVQRELAWLYGPAGARIVACVGGMDPRREQRLLAAGSHIVVGTPGRLRDHLERGQIDLSGLRAVVLDEADEMLDLGFRDDLEFLLDATPEDRHTLLFSATMPRGIAQLAARYQRNALRIEVATTEGGHADIDYRAIRIVAKEAEHVVVNVLRFYDSPGAIVFCNTRETVRHLTATLQERQFSVVALSGELGQNERNQALQALRDGRARVCVATDVAARGIDLPGLGLVVHAELPHDAESLQHRSGRTGRAGRKGVSVLLVPPNRRRKAEMLLSAAGVTPEWEAPPSADAVRALDHERMLRDAVLADEPGEDDLAAGRALMEHYSPEHIAAALVRIYRARLPAPEEVEDPGEGRVKRDQALRARFSPSEDGRPGSQWFRIPVGRRRSADPRWLLPLICRRGSVTKDAIGAIRIFDAETAFEVAMSAVPGFLDSLKNTAPDDLPIEAVEGDFSPVAAERKSRPRTFGKGGPGKGGSGKSGPGKGSRGGPRQPRDGDAGGPYRPRRKSGDQNG